MIRILAFILVAVSAMSPAWAQPAKIFVASTGSDTNDGSRSNPKRSFQAAHDAVAAGGEIVVLDTAGYGTVLIRKSIGIIAPLGVAGLITVSDGNGITIAAGANDTVAISGLVIESEEATSGNGIDGQTAGQIIISDCIIRNFNIGIVSTATQIVVRRGAIRGSSNGVILTPYTNTSSNYALVSDLEISGAKNWALAANGEGRPAATASLVAFHCSISNSGSAIQAIGAGSYVTVDGCVMANNSQAYQATSGGRIYSRGNNTIQDGAIGTTPMPWAGQ